MLRRDSMSLSAKYQYTHFIYPFLIEKSKYTGFINNLLDHEKDWKLKIHNQKEDEETYNFFLPYMRKFLFPTLFWNNEFIKKYKSLGNSSKASVLRKASCIMFDFNLDNIKVGTVSKRRYDIIDFNIISIRVICFEPGVCFLDIKTEVEDDSENIDFDKILDFNNMFREITPKNTNKSKLNIKAKGIDNIHDITIFIKSIISGFENNDINKIYYDKMFTYSYVCVGRENWNESTNFDSLKNDFYKFQYVVDSKSSAIFNNDCTKLDENTYSRWKYSMFGFSRESGVVLVSEEERYNITKMPHNFEKDYLYMLLLAFYQRMSLINFLQDLLKKDKTMIPKLNYELTKFTHFSWFSQITNSEHGMDIWKRWQSAFELSELYDEVHKEYVEYYNTVVTSGQSKINIILIIMYTVSVIFSGLQIVAQMYDIKHTWLEPLLIYTIVITAMSYPIYAITRWMKHKAEKYFGGKS
jgi:hypothetical protein